MSKLRAFMLLTCVLREFLRVGAVSRMYLGDILYSLIFYVDFLRKNKEIRNYNSIQIKN